MDSDRELVGERYAIERKLGRGGVGEVFLAHDIVLDRWVAIKKIHTATGEVSGRSDTAMREARQLANFQHTNIVTVYDFIQHADDVMVVMEFVQGETLEEIEAPLALKDFVEMARQSLDGLGAAHTVGVVHRDIKPSNIMLAGTPGGKFQVKILDFGLAKMMAKPTPQTIDHSGSLMGSIYTISPEQLDGRPISHRADIYSLGCVFYHALTKRNPFEGETVPAIITAHLRHEFSPLAPLRPDLPQALCGWVQNLFALEPANRPESAPEALANLQGILAGRPVLESRHLAAALVPPRGTLAGHPALRVPAASHGITTGIIATRPAPKKPAGTPSFRMATPPPRAGSRNAPLFVTAGLVLAALAAGAFFFLKPDQPANQPAPTADSASARKSPPLPTGAPEFAAGDREGILGALGREVSVTGTIGNLGESNSGTVRFLNFEGVQRGGFSLVFRISSNEEFTKANLEKFIGGRVRVTGRISSYQGIPQIAVENLAQISLEKN